MGLFNKLTDPFGKSIVNPIYHTKKSLGFLGLGGSSNKASDAAEEAEAERRALIAAANQRIEGIFGSPQREADILGVEGATRQFLTDDLDRKKVDTDRNLKFSLARSGLTHGSVDADQNSRLGDDYLRGILEVERRSKAAGTSLRSEDQATKNSLFSQILGGLDTTTAAQQAAHALQQNIALTKSQSLQQGVGDMFGGFSNIFERSREGAADRRASFDFNTLYGNRQRTQPSVAGGF
jgi:hypothetical protein